jgi:signal transduction histidine kinase
MRLRSLRVRLIAVFAAVVVTAMGVLFLYVVPSLRANLIADRQARLASIARNQQASPRLKAAFQRGTGVRPMLDRVASLANAQVSLFRSEGQLLVVDPGLAAPVVGASNPVVASAATGADPVVGRSPTGNVIVAFSMPGDAVVLLSQRVGDVNDAATLVERQFLIATVLALGVAGLVGWAAAVAISQRLTRLELAASRVAAGSFDQPIGDQTLDELGRVARSFDLMQSRLAQIDRARKDFIANASHELRTPLFSLGGFLELMENEDLDPATRDEFLHTMREQVTRLTKLATDLLDLSRLDSGAVAIEREPIDLASTARVLVREFRGLAAKHGSRVVLDRSSVASATGVGDEQRVLQIGRALVDNAIRHNPRGTLVGVSVGAEDGVVSLAVTDDGRGIDETSRDHVFERFHRGQESTAAGSGLGLAIARELAQRMDGGLEANFDNAGSRFSLTLPAAGD